MRLWMRWIVEACWTLAVMFAPCAVLLKLASLFGGFSIRSLGMLVAVSGLCGTWVLFVLCMKFQERDKGISALSERFEMHALSLTTELQRLNDDINRTATSTLSGAQVENVTYRIALSILALDWIGRDDRPAIAEKQHLPMPGPFC